MILYTHLYAICLVTDCILLSYSVVRTCEWPARVEFPARTFVARSPSGAHADFKGHLLARTGLLRALLAGFWP